MHREDIKAALRKGFGSLSGFETSKGLPAGSVTDVLRGRASSATETAISDALDKPLHVVFPSKYVGPTASQSIKPDDSAANGTAHRLTADVG